MIAIDKLHTASFDVDAQKTFTTLCPTELPVPEGDRIAESLNAQAQFARYRVGSKDAHSPKALWVANEKNPVFSPIAGIDMDIHWPVHAVPGTLGFELLEGLPHPREYDFFVWKGIEPDMHPYGACYHDFAETLSTGLIEFLRSKKIDTIIVGGLALDYCVKTTALQLLRAGFRVIINLSATASIAPETENAAKKLLKEEGTIFIEGLDELQCSSPLPLRERSAPQATGEG
jgi:nicotinamidase/pyrazinamidase